MTRHREARTADFWIHLILRSRIGSGSTPTYCDRPRLKPNGANATTMKSGTNSMHITNVVSFVPPKATRSTSLLLEK